MSARTVLSLLLITMTLPTACQAVPVSPAEESLRPYQVPQAGLALDVPTGWALMPGPQEIHMRRTSLVTLNNLGQGNLWITEQPVGPSGSEYGPDAVLATLPPGGVYVELANIGGPAVSLIGPEIEPGDLAALNAEATWATWEDDHVLRRELLFARWGQRYALTAYAVEPINPADRAIVEHIFDSLRLTTQPASAARASIALARAHLPPETRPGLFPLRAGQTEAGGIWRRTWPERDGEDVVVTFTYGRGEPGSHAGQRRAGQLWALHDLGRARPTGRVGGPEGHPTAGTRGPQPALAGHHPAKPAARPGVDHRCLRRPCSDRGHRRHLATRFAVCKARPAYFSCLDLSPGE